jgi:hypothetical protein
LGPGYNLVVQEKKEIKGDLEGGVRGVMGELWDVVD